jgi:SAM-dependent methyltransferase
MVDSIAEWAWAVLGRPGGGKVFGRKHELVDTAGRPVGKFDNDVVRFAVTSDDASIEYYRSIGGAHFHERSTVPFAMTTLDTPVYHSYLREIAPPCHDITVVDVGGGDGRNALPWLEWGYQRIIVIDPVASALWRFRDRVAARNAQWLKHLLLIEGDARMLPLKAGCADRVIAIESLSYLNEDFEQGLRECRRIMRSDARFMLADRDYEGGLLARLFYYGGLDALIDMGGTRDLWDGTGDARVRTRCFTREEMIAAVEKNNLGVRSVYGISAFSLIFSYMAKNNEIGDVNDARLAELRQLLRNLGRGGSFMRSHVVIADRGRDRSRLRNPAGRPAKKRRARP